MKYKPLIALLLSLLVLTLSACDGSGESSTGQSMEDSAAGDSVDAGMGDAVSIAPEDAPEEIPWTPQQSSGVLDVIFGSYSARGFAGTAVPDDDLQLILQSGLRAPSARNGQPWHLTAVTDSALVGELVNDAVAGTVVIVISGTSEEQEGIDVSFDCALATENMYLAAQSLGLGAHIYTGGVSQINQNHRETLQIPEGYDAVAILLVGHAEQADAASSASARNDYADMVTMIG